MDAWTVIARPLDLSEAHIIAGRLRAAGLEVRLGAEHHVATAPFLAYATNGVDIAVRTPEAMRARDILADVETIEDEDYEASDECPECGSRQVSRLSGPIASFLLFILSGLPNGISRPVRSCTRCGRKWIKVSDPERGDA